MFPVIQIGPLSLQTHGVIFLLGLWLALWVTERFDSSRSHSFGIYYDLALVALGAGILGARLGYAAKNVTVFLKTPLALITPTPQMLDLSTGIIFASLAALIYGGRRGLKLWPTLDQLTLSASVFAVALHLADLASGNAYGSPAAVPWCIPLWGDCRHPTQLYALLLALGITSTILRSTRERWPTGLRFWTFLALTALARLIIEPFRGDSTAWLFFRQPQIIAWILLAISLHQMGQHLHSISKEQEHASSG
ncbi:prolipoprotein diacylglyceryl transferase family protein [uncultured Thermanaerothrix sp.]|uniref:prolipoprotein diacylglyceryl transferase n=1 Tax=uncultured Thermanaerothrix sp. TaxID=1195149 RepID=UPI00261256D3|nr:prolipoprotein diacylglyceryl transferase family protein [uncultured Thermanaerothrix sp.]